MLMVLAFVLGLTGVPQAEKTPTQTYMEYHAALQKAKKADDIMIYMSASKRKEAASMPPEMKNDLVDVVKTLSLKPGFKVVKEEKTASGATLTVTGVDGMGGQSTTIVKMVRENGAWKIDEESTKGTIK